LKLLKVTDFPLSKFDQRRCHLQPSSWKALGSTAQSTVTFTLLLQQRWVLPYENRRIDVAKFSTYQKQTLQPCGTKQPKQGMRSSNQVPSTINNTLKLAARTPAHHTSKENCFPSLQKPFQSPKSCKIVAAA
jgi:hypothetical protein